MPDQKNFEFLKSKEIIVDFDGVITKLELDWEDLRNKFMDLLGIATPLDLGTLYLLARAQGKKEDYLKLKTEAELSSLNLDLTSDLFDYLKENGLRIHVLSNNTRETVEKFFSHHKFTDKLSTVISNNDVNFIKPNPEGLHLILQNKDPEGFIFIGDSVYDEIASGLAGVKFIKYQF
jgi:HAD superfamily hydrolase (TIGR01549 family)